MPLRDTAHANLYHVLGLEAGAGADELRAAYARLLRLHHPDTRGHLPARLEEIRHAYHTLADPERRDRYDRQLFAEEREYRARRHRLHSRLEGYDRRHPAAVGGPARRGWSIWLLAAGGVIAAGAAAAGWLIP